MEIIIISIYPEFYFKGYNNKSEIELTEDIDLAKKYEVNNFDLDDDDDETDEDLIIRKLNESLFIDINMLKHFNFKTELIRYEKDDS